MRRSSAYCSPSEHAAGSSTCACRMPSKACSASQCHSSNRCKRSTRWCCSSCGPCALCSLTKMASRHTGAPQRTILTNNLSLESSLPFDYLFTARMTVAHGRSRLTRVRIFHNYVQYNRRQIPKPHSSSFTSSSSTLRSAHAHALRVH